jgi:tetratricopeptide (TPR) repeat protein
MATLSIGSAARFDRVMRDALSMLDRDPVTSCKHLRAVIKEFPDVPTAHRALALALRRAGRVREADRADVRAIEVSTRQPAFAAAAKALANDNAEEAEILIRDQLKRDPEDAAAARMLGEIAARCGAYAEAENLYRRALILAPGYQDARIFLAKLLNRTGRNKDALATIREVLDGDESHRAALTLKAAILVQDRALEEGRATFKELTRYHPRDALGWMNFAYLLKTMGRLDESLAAYRRSVAIDPGKGIAWWGIANLKTIKFTDNDVAIMRKALAGSDVDDDDRVHLNFALGKALGDLKDYAASFAAYAEGNRLRRLQSPHDAARVMADVRSVERVFTPAFFEKRAGWGYAAPDPIFVVSLPRSGSTLIEQILASHPLVEGTEELYDIERIALELAPGGPPGAYVEKLANLSAKEVRSLGGHYIEATRRHRHTTRPFFTDKMPSNWVYTGLIHQILPNAKIIDIRRQPLSCGFANFSQHFNWGINFSYDLTDIGLFYSAYVRQMAHFANVLPGIIHHVVYENLVENFEEEVKRLLAYLGLPFDEACLRFFENTRAVHTPSADQVRRPINRDGMDRWRLYEEWLTPLKDALGPVFELYPDVPTVWRD